MGVGPFDFNRPLTAGDEGWLGVRRPLVGAANAIEASVTTQSAAQVAIANSTPDRLENLRDEINMVNRELDNKRAKMERLENIQEDVLMGFVDMTYDRFQRKREALFDDIDNLQKEKDRLVGEYDDIKQATEEGDLRPDEIKDGIEDVVEHSLKNVGISKGPFISVGGETTTIMFSKSNIREEDIVETEQRLNELGFQVGKVEGVEV